jgi:hypothetical protein
MNEGAQSGSLSLRIDGDLVMDNLVTARTLAKALSHAQNAIDRAYLDIKHDGLWKYARMSGDDYSAADFVVLYPEPGSFIQKIASQHGRAILQRISGAVRPAFERLMAEGEEEYERLEEQIGTRKEQVSLGISEPRHYGDVLEDPGAKVIRSYGDRCINREIDQIVSLIRASHAGESSVGISIYDGQTREFHFDENLSKKFHKLISRRDLGDPILYEARVRQLDKKDLSGKVEHEQSGGTSYLRFSTEEDLLKMHPFLAEDHAVPFIGAPVIEYGAFDPKAGDIFFIDLA